MITIEQRAKNCWSGEKKFNEIKYDKGRFDVAFIDGFRECFNLLEASVLINIGIQHAQRFNEVSSSNKPPKFKLLLCKNDENKIELCFFNEKEQFTTLHFTQEKFIVKYWRHIDIQTL